MHNSNDTQTPKFEAESRITPNNIDEFAKDVHSGKIRPSEGLYKHLPVCDTLATIKFQ